MLKIFKKIGYRVFNKFKKPISKESIEIYKIVLLTLHHPNSKLFCDLKTSDMIIELDELGYHIVITKTKVIVTNHDFPNLGDLETEVVNKIIDKVSTELSKIRQLYKQEILSNNRNLILEVKEKVKASSFKARLKLK
jgi:hypothetical protein